jgi:glucose-1-phosphatase
LENIKLIEKINEMGYTIFLLSNTNQIHYRFFSEQINKSYGWQKFCSLFNTAYFSHEIGMRKPDAEIFEYVLSKHSLQKHETLFIDDSIQHIHTANSLQINTIHLTQNINSIFK